MRDTSNRLKLLFLLIFSTSCLSPLARLRAQKEVTTVAGPVRIYFRTENVTDAQRILDAAQIASQRVQRMGNFSHSVSIYVLPTHDQLEAAVGRRGYDWLKAWAMWDVLYVQAPSTWSEFATSQKDIEELLTHELTHCLMFQMSSNSSNWQQKKIPFWFREGMASFVAQQGYRWVTMEELAKSVESTPIENLLAPSANAMRKDSTRLYSVAHQAFSFFHARYGEAKLRDVLEHMKSGDTFPEAFEKSTGLQTTQFGADFGRFLRYRGFRSGRTPVSPG